jgi:hypothetical protein
LGYSVGESFIFKLGETAAKDKGGNDYGKLDSEGKDFSAVALYGSGYVGPQCIGLHGSGRYRGTWGDADECGDVRIHGTLLADSFDHGFSVSDPEGLRQSLGEYRSGHSLHASEHLAFN